jgi:O-antigen ligase
MGKKCNKNAEYILTLFAGFSLIALPLYSTNKLWDYIKVFAGINIFQILLLIVITLQLLKKIQHKKIIINYSDILVFIFFCITVIQLIRGKCHGYSSEFILRDLNLYLLPFMIYIAYVHLFRSRRTITLKDVLRFLMEAQMVCNFLNILMYLTRSWAFWGVTFFANGRFGGSYQTLGIFTLGYAMYLLIESGDNEHVFWIIIYIVSSLVSVLLSLSRVLLIFSLLSMFIVILTLQKKNRIERGLKKNRLVLLILVVNLLILFILILIKMNAGIVGRLLDFSSISEDVSFLIRIRVYKDNFQLMINDIFGTGLGYPFKVVDETGTFWGSVSNVVDCTYLTVGVKQGIVAFFIYLIISVKPANALIKAYRRNGDRFYLSAAYIYILWIVQATLLSAQSLSSLSSSTALWIIFAFITSRQLID